MLAGSHFLLKSYKTTHTKKADTHQVSAFLRCGRQTRTGCLLNDSSFRFAWQAFYPSDIFCGYHAH